MCLLTLVRACRVMLFLIMSHTFLFSCLQPPKCSLWSQTKIFSFNVTFFFTSHRRDILFLRAWKSVCEWCAVVWCGALVLWVLGFVVCLWLGYGWGFYVLWVWPSTRATLRTPNTLNTTQEATKKEKKKKRKKEKKKKRDHSRASVFLPPLIFSLSLSLLSLSLSFLHTTQHPHTT